MTRPPPWAEARHLGQAMNMDVLAARVPPPSPAKPLPLAAERWAAEVCVYCGNKTGLQVGSLAIMKDDKRKRIIFGGGEDELYVAEGVKQKVVDFILSQEEKQKEVKGKIGAAKESGDIDARKALMKQYQDNGWATQTEANRLQYGQ